jgi:hypothetical protein
VFLYAASLQFVWRQLVEGASIESNAQDPTWVRLADVFTHGESLSAFVVNWLPAFLASDWNDRPVEWRRARSDGFAFVFSTPAKLKEYVDVYEAAIKTFARENAANLSAQIHHLVVEARSRWSRVEPSRAFDRVFHERLRRVDHLLPRARERRGPSAPHVVDSSTGPPAASAAESAALRVSTRPRKPSARLVGESFVEVAASPVMPEVTESLAAEVFEEAHSVGAGDAGFVDAGALGAAAGAALAPPSERQVRGRSRSRGSGRSSANSSRSPPAYGSSVGVLAQASAQAERAAYGVSRRVPADGARAAAADRLAVSYDAMSAVLRQSLPASDREGRLAFYEAMSLYVHIMGQTESLPADVRARIRSALPFPELSQFVSPDRPVGAGEAVVADVAVPAAEERPPAAAAPVVAEDESDDDDSSSVDEENVSASAEQRSKRPRTDAP